jgi:hypothetical protein
MNLPAAEMLFENWYRVIYRYDRCRPQHWHGGQDRIDRQFPNGKRVSGSDRACCTDFAEQESVIGRFDFGRVR